MVLCYCMSVRSGSGFNVYITEYIRLNVGSDSVILYIKIYRVLRNNIFRASKQANRGAVALSVTVKPIGCLFDPYSRR